MKLYATVASERATKGQGGNTHLFIEIFGENKTEISRIKVTNPYPHEHLIEVFPVEYPNKLKIEVKGHGYILKRKDETKVKKQKDEICEHTGQDIALCQHN